MYHNRNAALALLATFAATMLDACEAGDTATFPLDFENYPLGNITTIARASGWLYGPDTTRRADVVNDGPANKALRVEYPAGQAGSADSGAVFIIGLTPSTEYYLSYRVKLDDGFDFKNGGKLPGLSSAGCSYTGGRIPTAGDGWSARLWWGPEGVLAVYFYHVGMQGPWGEILPLTASPLTKTEWHSVVQRVLLNTADEPNGVLQVWLDGSLVLDRHNLMYRLGDMGQIEGLCFSTFHGGSDPEKYGPLSTGYALFDDFAISLRPPPATESETLP